MKASPSSAQDQMDWQGLHSTRKGRLLALFLSRGSTLLALPLHLEPAGHSGVPSVEEKGGVGWRAKAPAKVRQLCQRNRQSLPA